MKQLNRYCYDSRRIYTFYENARKAAAGIIPAPRMALIYPTRICNHSCYYCSDRWGNSRVHSIMPRKQLMALPKKLRKLGVQGVEMCGGGEPLMHPDMPDFIDEAARHGLKLAAFTNGSKLRGELLKKVVANFSYIRISVDTFDAKKYAIVRRPKTPEAGFDQVMKNIRDAVALKKKLKAPIQIGIKLSLEENSAPDVIKSVRKAKALGADSIQIKMARNSGREVSAAVVKEAKRQLEWAKKNIKGIVILGSLDKFSIDHKCWLSTCHMFIDTTGDARICCYFQFREKVHTYGNVFREPLEKVWYGKRHAKALRDIKISECNKWDCKYFIYNKIMKEALIEDEAQWQFV